MYSTTFDIFGIFFSKNEKSRLKIELKMNKNMNKILLSAWEKKAFGLRPRSAATPPTAPGLFLARPASDGPGRAGRARGHSAGRARDRPREQN